MKGRDGGLSVPRRWVCRQSGSRANGTLSRCQLLQMCSHALRATMRGGAGLPGVSHPPRIPPSLFAAPSHLKWSPWKAGSSRLNAISSILPLGAPVGPPRPSSAPPCPRSVAMRVEGVYVAQGCSRRRLVEGRGAPDDLKCAGKASSQPAGAACPPAAAIVGDRRRRGG